MNCPACGANNANGARFCSNCGTKLALACSNCGAEATAGAKFCTNCGQQLPVATQTAMPAASAIAPLTSTPAQTGSLDRFVPKELLKKLEAARDAGLMVGERRTVTMLFCDVQGSTAAASQLDPEEWAGIINGAFEQMIRPVYRFEGTVARLMGDGLLAFFGAPIAHEDDPERAVLAGLAIIEGLQPYAETVRRDWGIDLAVRVGVNTGLVVVGGVGSDLRMEYSALGDAINLAARMEQTAQPGTVQIAPSTYKLIAPLFDVETLEGLEIKGKATPMTVYRVLGRKARPGKMRGIAGLDSPLVGREREFAALVGALSALRDGRGGIVSLIGEAGLGKSRLASEARQALPDLRWAEGKSLSFETTTPFAPFGGVFRSLLTLEPDAGYATLVEQIESESPGQGAELAPFIAHALGIAIPSGDDERVKYLEPPMLRMGIFQAMAGLIEGIATREPLVLALDDLHWIDPTSLDLLRALLPLSGRAPLVFLLAFRPRSGDPSWELHESIERAFAGAYRPLVLQPLPEADARVLVRNLLTIEALPEGVRQLILDKSEGNPFYLEEVIRSLLDSGLVVQQDGHWRATREIVRLSIPDTLIGVITARLDRLDDDARQAAQAAAVLGREFSLEALADISGRGDSLEESLSILQQRNLIRALGGAAGRFAFKHVLTQEAAYESLLLSRRRQLHQMAATSLAAREPDQAAIIARHFLEARQPGQALPYLVQAGEQASRSFAIPEAIGFFEQSLAHPEVGDIADIRRAYEGLGAAQAMANPVEALVTYEKMLAAAESYGDTPMIVSALNKLAAVSALSLGQFAQGDAYLSRAERIAREEEALDGFAEASIIRCQMCTAMADFSRVIESMDKVIAIGESVGNPFIKTLGLEHTASSLMFMTRFDEAYEKVQETLDSARAIGDRLHEAWASATTLAICHTRNGDLDAALTAANEGVSIGRRIGAVGVLIYGQWLQAEIHHWRGEYEAALAAATQAMDAALPLEGMADFMVVQPMGALGSLLLDLDGRLTDRVAELHRHALRLLETPAGAPGGGSAWADLGWCAIAVGDLQVAREVFEKGLNHPTMFMMLEKPRHLAGMAMVLLGEGDVNGAMAMADEARRFAEERQMRHHYPMVNLVLGRVFAAAGLHADALEALHEAEQSAVGLRMRALLWRIQVSSAQSLAALGEANAAEAKLDQARETVAEIAELIDERETRSSYQRRMAEELERAASAFRA